MIKMLLKDFTALACGLICAILFFAILLHYNLLRPEESAAKYQTEQQKTINTNRALDMDY